MNLAPKAVLGAELLGHREVRLSSKSRPIEVAALPAPFLAQNGHTGRYSSNLIETWKKTGRFATSAIILTFDTVKTAVNGCRRSLEAKIAAISLYIVII